MFATLALAAPAAAEHTTSCCIAVGQITGFEIAPDGRFAYATDRYNVVQLARDRATGELRHVHRYGGGGGAAEIAPDGRWLYVAAERGGGITAYRLDPASGEPVVAGEVTGPASEYADLVVSRDGRTLYASAPHERAVAVYTRDPQSGALRLHSNAYDGIAGISGLGQPAALALSPDDRFLHVAAYQESRVVALRRGADGGLSGGPVGAQCSCAAEDVAVSPDGRRVYLGAAPYGIYDRDPETGALTARESPQVSGYGSSGDFPVRGLAVAPDSTAVYALDRWQNRLFQDARTETGTARRRMYRDFVDGVRGLKRPQMMAFAPGGDHLYVASGGPGEDPGIAVFRRDAATNDLTFVARSRVSPPPPMPRAQPPRVLINGGAAYTNDRDVVVTIVDVTKATSPVWEYTFSNDGGFADSETFQARADGRYRWRLATTGPERLPKTVYVRSLAMMGRHEVRDSIVLDETRPVVVAARAVSGGRRVRVRARDRISGVRSVQVAARARRAGRWRRYSKRSLAAPHGRRLRVRVRDRAGNVSRWRSVRGGGR